MTGASIPLVVLFGLVVVMLVRSREVRVWQAVVIGLCGFYLALSPVGSAVTGVVDWFISRFT